MAARRANRVAVIGAGAGGICAAKTLLAAQYDVTVYEAGSHVGGLWVYENDNGRAQAYRNLCIISTRGVTRYTDFDFDAVTPQFPTHWDMARYLRAYADHFGVTPVIRFGSPVKAIRPLPRPDGWPTWEVETDAGLDLYDAVVVATGHLSEPVHVKELREDFAGEYLHSNVYRTSGPFAGRRVCVVGVGNSGVDIASDVCCTASHTVLVARSPVNINPRLVFGRPYSDIVRGMRRYKVPMRVRSKLAQWLAYLAQGDIEKYGFQKPTKRQHPTSSESLLTHIAFNRIVVKPGIARIDGKRLEFADGSSEEVDVIIGATGYRVHLPFISPEVVPVIDNHVDLYKRVFVVGRPGLAFIGMLNPTSSTLTRIFEAQSRLVREYLDGVVVLPSNAEMEADIAAKNELVGEIFQSGSRHELEEPELEYFKEVEELEKTGRARAERAPAPRRDLAVR